MTCLRGRRASRSLVRTWSAGRVATSETSGERPRRLRPPSGCGPTRRLNNLRTARRSRYAPETDVHVRRMVAHPEPSRRDPVGRFDHGCCATLPSTSSTVTACWDGRTILTPTRRHHPRRRRAGGSSPISARFRIDVAPSLGDDRAAHAVPSSGSSRITSGGSSGTGPGTVAVASRQRRAHARRHPARRARRDCDGR